MSDVGPLYRITVRARTIEEEFGDSGDPELRALWDADTHRVITIEATAPDPTAGHTPEEVLTAHRWAAGVLARAALDLPHHIRRQAPERHHCQPDPLWGDEACGDVYQEYVVRAGWSADGGEYSRPPHVEITVPVEDAAALVRGVRRYIRQLIADDQRTPQVGLAEARRAQAEQDVRTAAYRAAQADDRPASAPEPARPQVTETTTPADATEEQPR